MNVFTYAHEPKMVRVRRKMNHREINKLTPMGYDHGL
jgi:hypothetical protein